MCYLPGSIAWQVEDNRDLVPPSQSPNAEVVGNFLVIASPDTYVTPGTAGRRDIVCTSVSNGQNYEVRLASPSKSSLRLKLSALIITGYDCVQL